MAESTIKNNQYQIDGLLSSINNAKTWTPHLYNYKTKVREFPGAGMYFKLGKIVIGWINANNLNFSGVDTMFQIRNLPCTAVIGGSAYFANISGEGAHQTIQMSNYLYIRPNVVSSNFPDPINTGWTSIFFVGTDI